MAFTHAKNSKFQYLAFIALEKHTADDCYRVLTNELEERTLAVRSADAAGLRTEAKILRAQAVLDNDDKPMADKLDAQADLDEIKANEPIAQKCYAAALEEINFLKQLIGIVTPHRKYKDLPDAEAFEAAQREEWCLEFMFRAETYFMSGTPIPPDQISSMRRHPDWQLVIHPYLGMCQEALRDGGLPPRTWKKPEFKMRLETYATQVGVALPPCPESLGVRGLLLEGQN